MSKKNLFLFTNSFPCNKALEHYIEHEMPFLSQNFERVYILPSTFGKIEIPVPSNVEVLNIYSGEYYKGGIKSFLLNLPLIVNLFAFELLHTRLRKLYWLSKSRVNLITLNNAIECAKAVRNILSIKKINKNDACFYSYWFYHSSLILSVAKKKGFINSFLSRGHQAEIYEEREPHKSLFKNVKLKYVDRLCLISGHAAKYLASHYPAQSQKYKVSYLGVDDHGVNPASDSIFRIVSCSKYAPHKRIHLIPEILKHVDQPYEWHHLGLIPADVQKDYMRVLENNKQKSVYFPGDFTNENVLRFYQAKHVDIFINVSNIEGLSVAIMEAASFGIPSIATDINGTSEIVTDESGYLIPIEFNPSRVAEIVNDVIKNGAEKKRQGARNLFMRNFNARNNYERFVGDLKAV